MSRGLLAGWVLLAACSLWVRWGRDVDYALGIHPSGYAFPVKLEPANLPTSTAAPSLTRLHSSSSRPERVVAQCMDGRVFVTEDFGEAWRQLFGPPVRSARFAQGGELIRTLADGRVLRGETEVGPSNAEVGDRTRTHGLKMQPWDAGVSAEGRLWVLISDLLYTGPALGGPFTTVASDWGLDRGDSLDRVEVWLEREEGWQAQSSSTARALLDRRPSREVGLDFDRAEMELIYEGRALPSAFYFVGLVQRAAWLERGDRYFAMGSEGLQIASVSSFWPGQIASWGYVLNPKSAVDYGSLRMSEAAVWINGDQIHLLIPGERGAWRGRVPLEPVPSLRALAWFVAYSPLFWLIWGLSGAALVLVRQRARTFVRSGEREGI